MCLADFCREYTGVGVQKLHDDYLYTSLNFAGISDKEKCTTRYVKMTVKKHSHIYISVNQRDERRYRKNPIEKEFKQSRVRMMVGRLDKDDEVDRYITSGTGYRRNTVCEAVF